MTVTQRNRVARGAYLRRAEGAHGCRNEPVGAPTGRGSRTDRRACPRPSGAACRGVGVTAHTVRRRRAEVASRLPRVPRRVPAGQRLGAPREHAGCAGGAGDAVQPDVDHDAGL